MWLLISTILMSLIFVKAGINKINNLFYKLAIMGAIGVEIGAPLVLILSYFIPMMFGAARVAIYSLLIFTILATLLYHSKEGMMKLLFDKNLAIIGGLMALTILY